MNLRRLIAVCATLALTVFAITADATRETPSTRLPSQATGSGSHSVSTVSIPSATTTAFTGFVWGSASNNQPPGSVSLDSQAGTKQVSNEVAGTMQLGIYSSTGMATGGSKTLSWANPVGFTALDIPIEYRDGSLTIGGTGKTDSDYCSGCGTLNTVALTTVSGDEVLCLVGANGGSLSSVGSGETILDQTSGTSDFSFVTKTASGTSTSLSFTFSGGLDAYACVVLHTVTVPTISAFSVAKLNNTQFRVTTTVTASPANTVKCGAWIAGTSTPSQSAVAAGTGAHGTASASATGSSQTIDITNITASDSPAFPLYKVFCVGDAGSGNISSVSGSSDTLLDPPSGKFYVTLTSITSGGAVDCLNVGCDGSTPISPAWAIGDTLVCPIYTQPTDTDSTHQFKFQMSVAGLASYSDGTAGGGDGIPVDGRRTYANCNAYRYSAGHYAAPTDGSNNDLDYWVNDPPISCGGPPSFDRVVKLNVAMNVSPNLGNLDFAAMCPHPLGDAETVTHPSGTFPTGISLSGATVSGTPTVANNSGASQTMRIASNLTGQSKDQVVVLYPVANWPMSDCSGGITVAVCLSRVQTEMHGSVRLASSERKCKKVANTTVLTQSPSPGSNIAPFSSFTLTESKTNRECAYVLRQQGE